MTIALEQEVKKISEGLKNIKIMDNIRRNEDFPIICNMRGEFMTFEEFDDYIPSKGEYQLTNLRDFAKVVSFGQKYLEDARYDVIGRMVKVLIKSFGLGIEEYIVSNIIPNKESGVWGTGTVVSPSLLHDKFQRLPASFALKGNKLLTNLNKYPPQYAILEDSIQVRRNEFNIEIIGNVKLAFSEEKFTLYEVKDA